MAFDPNVNNADLTWAPGADRPSNEYPGWHWDPSYGMYVQDAGTDAGGDPNVNNADITFAPGSDAPSNPPPAGWVWDPDMARYVPAPQTPDAPAPPPDTSGGDGGGASYTPPPPAPYTPPPISSGGGSSSYTPPVFTPGDATTIANNPPQFNAPAYTPPPAFSYADFASPVTKPGAFSYADFTAPSAEDVYKDPSFTLRQSMGQQALENSAAARGR